MKPQDFRFSHRMRVRWVEVDMQKIVFNGHYLMYFDTAVTEYWRKLAMPYAETMHQLGGDLFVKKASIEYHASAEMDDFLTVCMRCDRIGNSSMTFVGAIFRGDELLITSELVYVYADPVAKKSQPIAAPLRDMMEGFERGEDMVQVHVGSWHDFKHLASPLRTEVFVHEQKVPAEMEWDHEDDTALHAVALNRMGMPLATGRLLQHAPSVARIGRMAVKKPMRGSDLGHRVLHALMDAAKNRGDTQVVLHAQCNAEGFYTRAGFVPHGAIFEEAGIAHIEMVRQL
ncbi:YbgC/FadM family acyl-CoA thioesterase [Limnohabitans sp.]|jgi:YbgC/YbaW family acyl-CoA thioester hydrolase|uniref:YbgC/FadM family acyl-CoA thioesterase n=1 Tax=Limnohabitans sp. TaxID=1907725 RepID=UPI0037BEFF24